MLEQEGPWSPQKFEKNLLCPLKFLKFLSRPQILYRNFSQVFQKFWKFYLNLLNFLKIFINSLKF